MAEFVVYVKHLSEKSYKFMVTPDSTVMDLKKLIEKETKIPAEEIKLICKGKILKVNDDKMKDLNITPETTVHMIHQKPTTEADKAKDQTSAPFASTGTTGTTGTGQVPPNPFAAFGSGGLGAGGLSGLEGMDFSGLGGVGGMGGMGGPGGMNFAQMQQMMSNPQVRQMMQNMLQNPDSLRNMIQNNPMLRQMTQNNPQLEQVLNDPNFASNMSNAMNMLGGMGAPGATPATPGATGTTTAQGATAPNPGSAPQPFPNLNFANLMNNPAFGGAPQSNLPPEERYKEQLIKLADMGFTNKDLNIQVLDQSMGNVEVAIEKLLSLFK